MYADRIEAEARSVKSRLTGIERSLLAVRGRVSFKRTGAGRGRGRSSSEEKWQHDLFEEAETMVTVQAHKGGDLRALLASKQQAKLGTTRLAGRVGPSGLSTARAAVAAASDVRNSVGGARRRGGRVGLRRRPTTGGLAAAAPAQTAQKRITVTLQNDEEEEEEQEEIPAPAVVRGGRGSLLVAARADDDDVEMDEDGGAMPGQPPLPAASTRRQTRSFVGGSHDAVAAFLESLGLSKYTATFAAEEIDMAALRQMTEEDLKELGIPMGPRKKILQAVIIT